ncbi:MAG: bifunctional adenosylcobinamide kinase/adenosylcobinamide-phosphate guanylyltransferase [Pseudomonadota bacterium]
MRELILGGARSGKSALAEKYAHDSGLEVVYIATAEAHDDEMRERIAHHRTRRPDHWLCLEQPLQLAATLRQHAAANRCLLVDCLTLWLSNLLAAGDKVFIREREALLEQLPQLPGRLILVSNEVGMGIVPMGELTRKFCDESGRLHQAVAAECDRVTFVTAGLPMILKGESE